MVALRLAVALLALCVASAGADGPSEPELIESRLVHLRSGPVREWSSFPETADAQRLELTFSAAKNADEVTLRLRQQDVKQPWFVILNGTKVGELVRDENNLVFYLPVPPGWPPTPTTFASARLNWSFARGQMLSACSQRGHGRTPGP